MSRKNYYFYVIVKFGQNGEKTAAQNARRATIYPGVIQRYVYLKRYKPAFMLGAQRCNFAPIHGVICDILPVPDKIRLDPAAGPG